MKILNVNSCLGLARGAGTAERTFQMSKHVALEKGVECTVLTLDLDLSEERKMAIYPAKIVSLPVLNERFYVPRPGYRKISKLVKESDVIHLMGHWDFINVLVFLYALLHGKPYVVCPAGALPIYGRSRVIKRIFNMLVGRSLVRRSSAKIAITKREISDFSEYGVDKKEVVVIPNGISCYPELGVGDGAELELTKPYVLFMGRLNLIKGPDILLEAFRCVSKQFSELDLVFAGPDGGLRDSILSSAKAYGLDGRVRLVGYVDGPLKDLMYKNAELLVVPSRQEAMSIVALEAGAQATPVLVSENCGLSEIRNVDDRLEFSLTITALTRSMGELLSDRRCLVDLGERWQDYIKSHYTWDIIAKKYVNLYATMLEKKDV